MKKINLILGALVCMFAFSACTEEVEYTPASAENSAGFYFLNTNPTTIELSKENNTFAFNVGRNDASPEAEDVLKLEVVDTMSNGLFVFPDSVKFESGKKVASVTVQYDPEKLVYDEFYDITVKLEDPTSGTSYGNSEYTFKVGISAPWISLGKCKYTDDIVGPMFSADPITYEVEIQESSEIPGYYRLVNPYGAPFPYNAPGDYDDTKDYYMYIDATNPNQVYFPLFMTGTNWGYGEIGVLSLAYYFLQGGDTASAAQCYGQLKDGIITFPVQTLLIGMTNYNDFALYYANNNGMFKIVMPGVEETDYSVGVKYLGRFTDTAETPYAEVKVSKGVDVEAVKVAMAKTEDVDALKSGIINGTVEYVELSDSGIVRFPLQDAGIYSVAAISFANDEVKESADAQFEYSAGPSDWESMGMATYTDGFVTTFYNVQNLTYQVEVEKNVKKEGLYRLVNPYGEAYGYNGPGDWDDSRNYYLEINAMDPQGVYIPTQALGFDWGNGMFSASSLAYIFMMDYGYDVETLKMNGYFGTLEDGVITFPTGTLAASLAGYDGGEWYIANCVFDKEGEIVPNSGTFKVVLPGASANAASAKAVNNKTSKGSKARHARAQKMKQVRALKNATPFSSAR